VIKVGAGFEQPSQKTDTNAVPLPTPMATQNDGTVFDESVALNHDYGDLTQWTRSHRAQ